MSKFNEKEKTIVSASDAMTQSIRNEKNNFGSYYEFLKSVGAMSDTSVLQYPNNQLDEYEKRFVAKHEKGLSDGFVFAKCKVSKFDSNGNPYESGYFIPRIFWDSVL